MSCPECGGQMAYNALSCPKCGYIRDKFNENFFLGLSIFSYFFKLPTSIGSALIKLAICLPLVAIFCIGFLPQFYENGELQMFAIIFWGGIFLGPIIGFFLSIYYLIFSHIIKLGFKLLLFKTWKSIYSLDFLIKRKTSEEEKSLQTFAAFWHLFTIAYLLYQLTNIYTYLLHKIWN